MPRHQFACPACWGRLPFELRQPIRQHFRRDPVAHLEAMATATTWFRRNAGVRT